MTPTQVKLIDEVLTPERKREIVAEITEAILAMERENNHESAWVIIQEARGSDRRNGSRDRASRNMQIGDRRNLVRVTMNVTGLPAEPV
jgi:phenylpyruvate tautomerase PptA (4-oxalocrotonate tautomerase family)